ncbi:MAG: hypothetical protein ACUVUC_10220 [Thermoguttaceae bacterium]
MKPSSAEELQIAGHFEQLRRILLGQEYAGYMDKPLAYWALPSDRRLPLAFLGRTLRDLLETPFAELSATRGIGRKKICSFVKLLGRVANTDPSQLSGDLPPVSAPAAPEAASSANGFDPAAVSEVVWRQWRATVLRHGLGKEPLGRFAPSLSNMTRVIWNRPLETYTTLSLAEIRQLKTHGEKRIRAILEVFHALHSLLAGMVPHENLVLRILPRHIDAAQRWVEQALQQPGIPSEQEIFARFIQPLLAQLRIDASPQIVSLAENRLGLRGPITSVRQAARSMGLTRARLYQLLNEINDIMNVRWPNGRHQVYELEAKFRAESARLASPARLQQFAAAIELFYPRTRRGAAGPLERAEATPEPIEAQAPEEPGFSSAEAAGSSWQA